MAVHLQDPAEGSPVWLTQQLNRSKTSEQELKTEKDILFCQHHLSNAAAGQPG